jgi:hypothetical protein
MRPWSLARLVVLALVAAGIWPAMAGAAGWSLERAANAMEPHGSLAGVSCSSRHWCVAVGDYVDPSNLDAALIEKWDGASWTIVPAPNPPGTRVLRLFGVSCTSATACVAVGYRDVGTGSVEAIAEHWNGSSWTLETMPAGVSELYGVSCSSAKACTAVGGNQVVRWDGTSWTTQTLAPPPNVNPQSPVRMTSVSCASATSCTAVGFYFPTQGALQPVAERWDGTSWRVDATPLPSGDAAGELQGVSCSSPSACTAVGEAAPNGGASSTLALRWDGTSWTPQATPNLPGSNSNMLNGVSCASATACVAVGPHGLAAHWDGTTWTLDANPQPTLDQTVLTGVSCASTSSCTAVGGPGHTQPTMAEHWNGTTWTVQPTPPAIGALDTQLEAVSCPLASSCVAVGGFSNNGSQPLAERWDGSSWTVQSIPGPAGVTLHGVSCSASSACTAVGFSDPNLRDPRQRTATAERWNGTTWTSQPIPAPVGAQGTALYSVSCPSASSCTAVGDSFALTDGKATALVERWDGSSWTVRSTPSPVAADQSALYGVSCSSTTACTAVGAGYTSAGPVLPLAERWDGQSWTIQPTLTPPASVSSTLIGVSCSADTACTAVGSTSGSGSTAPLAERWNGTAWTIQSTPSASATTSVLSSVSCPSTTCTGTGYYVDGSGASHPLAERWDGAAWAIQPAPEPANDLAAYFNGVSCASDSACQTVGYADNIANAAVALADGYG